VEGRGTAQGGWRNGPKNMGKREKRSKKRETGELA